MTFTEHIIDEKEVFSGKIVTLRHCKVRLPSGKEVMREIVNHAPAVVIVPAIVTDTGQTQFCLVRQYRIAVQGQLTEFPAGLIDEGESSLQAAKRELKEETGYEAQDWVALGVNYPSPGFCNEQYHFYQALGLQKGEMNLDEDEFIQPFLCNQDELLSLIKLGNIKDCKTILGYYYFMANQKGVR